MVKVCSNCRVSLTEDMFSKRRASPDGLAYRCRPCDNSESTKWRTKNPRRSAELKASAYQRRRDHYDACTKKWVTDHKSERAIVSQRYYAKNVELHRDRVYKWRSENPGAANEIRMRRVSAKLNATPKWLTTEQNAQMRSIYKHAVDCHRVSGQRYQVDHIVPLQGDNVCGLHVPWNLQVLPSDLNTKKANRHDDWNTYN